MSITLKSPFLRITRLRKIDEEYQKKLNEDEFHEIQTTMLPKWEFGSGSKYHEMVVITNNVSQSRPLLSKLDSKV